MPSTFGPVTARSGSTRSIRHILDYETLKKYNPENLVTISVMGGGNPVAGIMDPDGQSKFAVQATYKPLVDQSTFLQKAQDPVNLVSTEWGNPQVMINSLRLSEKSFKGFEAKNGFAVRLSVPVMCEEDNPAQIAYTILSYACGTRASGANNNGVESTDKVKAFGQDVEAEFVLYAPNKYRIIYQGGTGGKLDVPQNATQIRVGNRFLYSNVLINNAEASFSDTVYHDGKPTFLNMTVSFEYWRQIDLSTLGDFLMLNPMNSKIGR